MNMKKILKSDLSVNPSGLRKIVDILLHHDLVHVTANGDLAVSRDLYATTLFDIYAIIPPDLANDENGSLISASNNVPLQTISTGVTECLKSSMDMPLATLLEESNQQQL